MRSRLSKLLKLNLFFISMLWIFHPAFAAEEAAPEGDSTSAENKHKGKGSTVLQTSEWVEIEANIASLQTKVKAKREELSSLINEKAKLSEKDPKINEIVKSIGSSYNELRSLSEELEKQKSVLQFRFPERGAKSKRNYSKTNQDSQTIDAYERQVKTDQQLNRTLEKVEKTYGVEKTKQAKPDKIESDPESSSPLIQK